MNELVSELFEEDGTACTNSGELTGPALHPWFALMVKPRHEKTVSTSLRAKGYSEFLPLVRSRHRSGTGTREVDLPLFAGYVFCRFDPSDRLPILMTPGVFRIVGTPQIEPVNEQELEAVRKVVLSGLEQCACDYLNVGDQLSVLRGPLRGVKGTLQSVRGSDRLVVSITLLQRSLAVEVKRDWVVSER